MNEAVIVSGVRTAIGNYGETLQDIPWVMSPSMNRQWTPWKPVSLGIRTLSGQSGKMTHCGLTFSVSFGLVGFGKFTPR